MKMQETLRFLFARTIGNFLLIIALYGILFTFGQALWYEARFKFIELKKIHFVILPSQMHITMQEADPSIPSILFGPSIQNLAPVDTDFSLLIPKIGARAKIIANVDPMDASVFLPVLRQAVAHAQGTSLPDQKGGVYLFAHSTDNWWDVGRYNAIFYLLKDLRSGDIVTIFYKKKEYIYVVSSTIIKDSNDLSLLNKARKENDHRLILQTCWPPGTTWKRLYVIGEKK